MFNMEDMESLSMLISLKKSHLDLFAVITHIKLDTNVMLSDK
jgi:hypothetical protein